MYNLLLEIGITKNYVIVLTIVLDPGAVYTQNEKEIYVGL